MIYAKREKEKKEMKKMAERKRDSLLERACSYLGFHVEKCSNSSKILDRENREHKRFLPGNLVNGLDGLLEVEDLLKTKVFEHYHFSWNDSIYP